MPSLSNQWEIESHSPHNKDAVVLINHCHITNSFCTVVLSATRCSENYNTPLSLEYHCVGEQPKGHLSLCFRVFGCSIDCIPTDHTVMTYDILRLEYFFKYIAYWFLYDVSASLCPKLAHCSLLLVNTCRDVQE